MSAKRAVYIASGVVIPLTFLYYKSAHSSDLLGTAILFFALFPGMAAGVVIAGPHGGTLAEETLATVVGAAANIAAYALLIFGAVKLFRRLTSH